MAHHDVTEDSFCPFTNQKCNFGVISEENVNDESTGDDYTFKTKCIHAIDPEDPAKFKCALWTA